MPHRNKAPHPADPGCCYKNVVCGRDPLPTNHEWCSYHVWKALRLINMAHHLGERIALLHLWAFAEFPNLKFPIVPSPGARNEVPCQDPRHRSAYLSPVLNKVACAWLPFSKNHPGGGRNNQRRDLSVFVVCSTRDNGMMKYY